MHGETLPDYSLDEPQSLSLPIQPLRLNIAAAVCLAVLLFYAILTLWVRDRWALSALEVGIYLLGSAWVTLSLFFSVPVRFGLLSAALLGAVLFCLLQLSSGITVYYHDTKEALLYWTAAAVLVFLASQVLESTKVRRWFLRALLLFGFVLSVLSVAQLYSSNGAVFWLFPSGYTDKVMGPFVYTNNFAEFVELLLPLALVEALRNRRAAKYYTLVSGVLFASIVASSSRAGIILATVETLAVMTLAASRGWLPMRRVCAAFVLFFVFAGIFSAVVGWGTLRKKFEQQDPYAHRREMLHSAVAMAEEKSWTGFGLGTFPTVYPAYAFFDLGLRVNHAHNDWAEWAAEGGVLFLGIMLSVAAWSIRPAFKSLWGLGIPIVFVHALVDYPMQRLGLAAWVFVMLGALAAWDHAMKSQSRGRLSP